MKRIFKYIMFISLLLLIPIALLYVPIGNNIILKIHTNELKHQIHLYGSSGRVLP